MIFKGASNEGMIGTVSEISMRYWMCRLMEKKTQWALVLAGISDLTRPAEKLSFTQNFSLMCTGAIWTRWCFIIKPQNLL